MMKWLAIDTSTEQASVALMMGDELISKEQGHLKTQAQFILPMIESLMSQSGVAFQQLDHIIFGCGPGSFTGLRIACSVAKGIAYAHDLGLIPVSSLDAIAFSARQQPQYEHEPVLAVLDARMNEFYWSYYLKGQKIAPHYLGGAEKIILPEEASFVLAGTGLNVCEPHFPKAITALHQYPSASVMLQLAKAVKINAVSAADAQPVYVRNQVTQGASHG